MCFPHVKKERIPFLRQKGNVEVYIKKKVNVIIELLCLVLLILHKKIDVVIELLCLLYSLYSSDVNHKCIMVF